MTYARFRKVASANAVLGRLRKGGDDAIAALIRCIRVAYAGDARRAVFVIRLGFQCSALDAVAKVGWREGRRRVRGRRGRRRRRRRRRKRRRWGRGRWGGRRRYAALAVIFTRAETDVAIICDVAAFVALNCVVARAIARPASANSIERGARAAIPDAA